ncbi:hypothetical protein K435DRAFT_847062 [Dendrothele bispora CBS 962.96]|uniref:Cytochrome c oxidase assembly factor 3 n=1 Tax=Dendrothele bispora (strain CBS 962.96) TaxID=1314807 RepID=A0A4S8MXN4_DENBC|nr:hypothetical protein K435DRAFT_847062 [Dendrothele bispora CBS 962.96]
MEGWDTKRYVDPRKAAKTWRPKSGSMSPGLRRARQPFLAKNIITGVLLSAFVIGVYSYSIRAVKQDEFDDIDEEAKARAFKRESELLRQQQQQANGEGGRGRGGRSAVLTVEEEKHTMEAAARAVASSIRGTNSAVSAANAPPEVVPVAVLAVPSPGALLPSSHNTTTTTPSTLLQAQTRGFLPKYLPFLLDPSSKTLVRGAPPVDDIGRVGCSSEVGRR